MVNLEEGLYEMNDRQFDFGVLVVDLQRKMKSRLMRALHGSRDREVKQACHGG